MPPAAHFMATLESSGSKISSPSKQGCEMRKLFALILLACSALPLHAADQSFCHKILFSGVPGSYALTDLPGVPDVDTAVPLDLPRRLGKVFALDKFRISREQHNARAIYVL